LILYFVIFYIIHCRITYAATFTKILSQQHITTFYIIINNS